MLVPLSPDEVSRRAWYACYRRSGLPNLTAAGKSGNYRANLCRFVLPLPGFTSTFTRGFISVAPGAPDAECFLVLQPASGDRNKAPGERTREPGERRAAQNPRPHPSRRNFGKIVRNRTLGRLVYKTVRLHFKRFVRAWDGKDHKESGAMSNHWSRIGLGVLCLGLLCRSLRAEAPAPVHDPAALAALIDHFIAEGYAAHKATPAAPADDAEYLRRVTLDLAGASPVTPKCASSSLTRRPTSAPRRQRPAPERPVRQPHDARLADAAAAAEQQPAGAGAGPGYGGVAAQAASPTTRLTTRWCATCDHQRRAESGHAPAGRPGGQHRPGVLPGQRTEAGEPGGRHVAAVPRRQAGVRPVPQPPVRQVDAQAVLGIRRLLRRRRPAGAAAGRGRR